MGASDVMKEYPNGDGPALEYDIDLSPKDGKGTVAIGILAFSHARLKRSYSSRCTLTDRLRRCVL